MQINQILTRIKSDNKVRNLIILGVLVIGIILTVVISQTVQQINSRASSNPSVILLSPKSQTVKKGEPLNIKILLETKGRNIMGADITLKYDSTLLALASFSATTDFTEEVVKNINDETGEIRFVIAETEDKAHSNEVIELGVLSFYAQENGDAKINLIKTQVVALGSNEEIPLSTLPEGSYTISETGVSIAPSQATTSKGEKADLLPLSFQLTDIQGNIKNIFKPGEKIYYLITFTNQGIEPTFSDVGYVFSRVYPNSPNLVEVNDTSQSNTFLRNGLFGVNFTKEYGSYPTHEHNAFYRGDKSFSSTTPGNYKARVFMNFDHKAREQNFENNQLTADYQIKE